MSYIPPGGFVGAGQQTQAAQLVGMTMQRPASRKRRASKKAKRQRAASAPKRRASRRTARPGRFVKGSLAAKRYMAKLRKMRKR